MDKNAVKIMGRGGLIDETFMRVFVSLARVNFCQFSLPLGVRDWLRFVIVAIPGLFYYLVYKQWYLDLGSGVLGIF